MGWGAGLLALSPLLAYVALRWGEGWHELREAVEATWLTLRHGALVRDLVARRQMLVDEVARAQEAVQTLERSNV